MAKNKKKKNGGKIYAICLAVYTLLLSCAAVVGLSFVWKYAEEYEASRPNNTMDAYVAELSKNFGGEAIEDTVKAMKHEVQSNSECVDIIKELLAGEISYVRKGSEGNTVTYALRIDGSQFGLVTVAQDESKADDVRFGMLPWIIQKEEFDFTGLYSSVQITVPESYTVELNGHELGTEYIVEREIKYDVLEKYYEIHDALPTKVTYKFDNVFGTLEPVVFNEDGEEVIIDETKDDSQFMTECSDAQIKRIKEFATPFCQRYYEFTTGVYDPSYGYQRLMPYMKLGSDLDERMKLALDGLSWANTTSVRIDSVTVNGGTDLGDGYYIADISAQTTTIEPSRGEVVGVHNMKVLLTDSGSEIRAITLELY